jgi:4-amino-4-deoxy-L-arabinose transferase-like glycosyltransferase
MQSRLRHLFSATIFGNRRTRIVSSLVLIWCAFVARGVFYSTAIPLWEGYDEPFHFAFVQYLATSNRLPIPTTLVSREIQTSFYSLPLPWTLQNLARANPTFTHDTFWKLERQQRENLQHQFLQIPKQWAKESATEPITNYESQQPPLYYVLLSVPLRSMGTLELASRIWWLRVLSVVAASFLVPLGFLVARKLLGNEMTALGIVMLATAMPELMVNVSRVGNESLAIVLYTLLVYVTLKVIEGPKHFVYVLVVGLLLGLGLLTKAYFLTALPSLFVILARCFLRWPSHRKALALRSGVAMTIAAAVAGYWYWRAHRVLGSWSGLYSEAALRSSSWSELLTNIWHVNWLNAVISVALSHIWYGAWSFLRVSNSVYLVFGAVMVLAALGTFILFVRLWTATTSRESESPFRDQYIALICFYGFFCLGLGYQVLTLFISEGVSASTGWYIYSLVIPELILVYCGLRTALPFSSHPWILPSLTTAFALLDLYGMHFLLLPYYSGIISHSAVYTGVFSHSTLSWVPAARLQQLMRTGLSTLADRLVINKPAFLTSRTLLLLWTIYFFATAWLFISSWRCGTFASNLEESNSQATRVHKRPTVT